MIKKIKETLLKYKEVILYLIFGALTTGVSWGIYTVFVKYLRLDINISNITSWIAAVIFAFITNKIWVFESKSKELMTISKEFIAFLGARVISGVVEIGGLPVLVTLGFNQTLLGVDAFPAKIALSVIVVILNYIFSKVLVFKKKKEDKNEL